MKLTNTTQAMHPFLEKTAVGMTYMISSAVTNDLNKLLVNTFKFQMHYFLVALQSILIVTVILFQAIFFNTKIRYSEINKWWETAALLTAMVFTNLKAVYYIPLTLFTLYKNFSIILIALLEVHFFGTNITFIGFLSFILMICSSLFGNTVDNIKTVGYVWMAINVISTAAYVLYMKKLMTIHMATRVESVFFTNLLSIPILAILSITMDPIELPIISAGLCSTVLLSAVAAYSTSFSTAWSMKVLSPTSYSMLGAMNKLVVSATGFLVFNEQFDITKIIALLVGTFSGLVYSLDSIRKRREQARGLQ